MPIITLGPSPWTCGKTQLDKFLKHFNNQHENINYTMGIAKDKMFPFLKYTSSKKQDNTLGHTVFRNPTHTNRYLHPDLHHYPAEIVGMKTLTKRTEVLAEESYKKQETNEVYRT